jgi:hypothetical protein
MGENTYGIGDTQTEVPKGLGAGSAMIIYNRKGTTTTMYGGALYGFVLYELMAGSLNAIQLSEFFFPVSPKSITMAEPSAVNIQYTMGGGKFVEHQGNVLKTLTVSGNTGFRPMHGMLPFVPGVVPLPTLQHSPLTFMASSEVLLQNTGMQHFLKLRNIFRQYWDRKADPSRSANTILMWYNFKEGEYFIVEPLSFDTQRDSGSPFTFNYGIQCQVIEFAETLLGFAPKRDMMAWRALVGSLNPLFFIVDLINFGSSLITELAQTIGVLGTLGYGIANELQNSVEGFQGALEVLKSSSSGGNAASTAAASVNAVLTTEKVHQAILNANDLQDALGDVTNDLSAYQNTRVYHRAYNTVNQAQRWLGKLHSLTVDSLSKRVDSSKSGQYQKPGQTETERLYPALHSDTSSNALSPFSRRIPTGYQYDRVQKGEDIFRCAMRTLGDMSMWKLLVDANNLEPPYISETLGSNILHPGDIIRVPVFGGNIGSDRGAIAAPPLDESGIQSVQRLNALLGTDIGVVFRSNGPMTVVEIATSKSGDLESVTGMQNMRQALNLKLFVERSSLPLHPEYGMLRATGNKGTLSLAQAQVFAFKSTMLSDNRVDTVGNIKVTIDGDRIDTRGDVKLKGLESSVNQALSTTT